MMLAARLRSAQRCPDGAPEPIDDSAVEEDAVRERISEHEPESALRVSPV